MRKITRWIGLFFLVPFILSGCAAPAVLVGGVAAVGAASGTYIYLGGELQSDYHASFDRTWSAVEKMMAQMRAVDVKPHKEIAEGRMLGLINQERVTISVRYKARNLTTVAIRVGTLGNRISSQHLHDRIADQLTKN
jgi:hypothetical protein